MDSGYHPFSDPPLMSQPRSLPHNVIVAEFASSPLALDARHPAAGWNRATAVTFSADWQGKHSDAGKQTIVRVLWNPDTIYLRFECRYRSLFVFPDSNPNGRRDKLWERDVAEVFLQPDPSAGHYYKEFEVSPNGMWIDLDISPKGLADLKSGMDRSVWLDETTHTWTAELAIPIKSIASHFDPADEWRVNFFRVEGESEPRFYSAWQPTSTPKPNFHVPSAFGHLKFAKSKQRS